MSTIGILHPGEMGAAVGATLVGAGHTVLWASTGRSMQTADRAAAAGLRDVGTLAKVVSDSELVLSICPPHAAEQTAREAMAAGLDGIYVDANAISPASAARVADLVIASGATPVDGGIVGLPPRAAGTTRLYLSGHGAAGVAERFAGTTLEAIVLDGARTAASALKMAYAAWTKGRIALLLATEASARALGVDAALAAEQRRSQPEVASLLDHAHAAAAAKGWRWVAEMEEIAATFAASGEPEGFHRAAAEVFRRYQRP